MPFDMDNNSEENTIANKQFSTFPQKIVFLSNFLVPSTLLKVLFYFYLPSSVYLDALIFSSAPSWRVFLIS